VTRRVIRLLGSAAFATWLLVIVGTYSAIASFVPQGGPSDPAVAAWAAAYPVVGFFTRVLGMHHAFTSFVFLTCAALLGVSAVLCSWKRTKVAVSRSRELRRAITLDGASLADDHDLDVPYDPALDVSDVLSRATDGLDHIGISVKNRDGVLFAVSSRWGLWGSPVFHWALVALVLVLIVGSLQSAQGIMGLAVGQTKPHAPSSYGFAEPGPIYDWARVQRAFRLDRFEADINVGGINRGPTPTVSVLDSSGRVIKTQRVYPNSPLHSGSLTVHSRDYGLAARVTVLDAAGKPIASAAQLVDFSEEDPSGTVPVGRLAVEDDNGAQVTVRVTIPLDQVDGQNNYWMPRNPTGRVAVESADGAVVADEVLSPGGTVVLPVGKTLRFEGVDWYARLVIVDNWTIPLVYTLLAVATIGLTITLFARQQVLVAAVATESSTLAIKTRLWRNVPCTRDEIVDALGEALGSDVRGSE